MNELNWTTEKPVFDDNSEPCILITAANIQGDWEYTLFTIGKFYIDEKWYWAIYCEDGEEWGDYDDFHAQKYAVINKLKQ